MAAVGFELYVAMLDEAVALLSGTAADEAPEPVRLDIPVDAFVPGDYVLSASIPGFRDGSTKVTIAGPNVRRDLSLPVGALEETITVIGRARDGFVPAERVTRDETVKPTSCDDTIPSGRIKPPLKLKDVRPVYPENIAATNGGGVVLLDA